MRDDVRLVSDLSVLATGAVFVVGLVVLGFRLAQVQLVDVAKYLEDGSRQAARRVQTAGPRGRIIARDGTVLADNRASVTIVLSPEAFQRRHSYLYIQHYPISLLFLDYYSHRTHQKQFLVYFLLLFL